MVFGDHDNNFKELNSLLGRECLALDWTGHTAYKLTSAPRASPDVYDGPPAAADMYESDDDVMAATARSSGRRLRDLGGANGGAPGGAPPGARDPRELAAAAALRRLEAVSDGAELRAVLKVEEGKTLTCRKVLALYKPAPMPVIGCHLICISQPSCRVVPLVSVNGSSKLALNCLPY